MGSEPVQQPTRAELMEQIAAARWEAGEWKETAQIASRGEVAALAQRDAAQAEVARLRGTLGRIAVDPHLAHEVARAALAGGSDGR